jgi:putative transposase
MNIWPQRIGILRAKLPSRLRLSDPERATLAEIGRRLGRKALRAVACVANPRPSGLVSKARREDGTREYGWGYDRIVGALTNLGHRLSDQTAGNILRRHGIAPVPQRSRTTSWKDFIAAHMNVLAGADFFTVEVLSRRSLVPTMYCSSFIWKAAGSA